jgi:muramoyltetrapeptide carboxypeptidase LdcA involved in peptidoglycan recycling
MSATDADKASDVNAFLNDDAINAIISNRGGWGTNKLVRTATQCVAILVCADSCCA